MAVHHSPGFLKVVEMARKQIRELTVDQVKAKLDKNEKFHLIDVREESEWAKDHVKGAKHLSRKSSAISRNSRYRRRDHSLLRRRLSLAGLAAENLQKMLQDIFSWTWDRTGERKRHPLTSG